MNAPLSSNHVAEDLRKPRGRGHKMIVRTYEDGREELFDPEHLRAADEIDRLTARVAELERYLMRIDVCSLDKEFMRKLAGEALYGKRTTDETTGEPTPHGVVYDKRGWVCSVCGGWNVDLEKFCQHPHSRP